MSFESIIYSLIILFLSFLISVFFVKNYISYARKHGIIDTPTNRSSHQLQVPRGGGVGFIVSWIVGYLGLLYFSNSSIIPIEILLPPLMVISILGFLDDIGDLSFKIRLSVQLLVAAYIAIMLGNFSHLTFSHNLVIPTFGLGGLFIALLCVWFTNLFNFMDGIDGIAASETIHFFVFGSIVYLLEGNVPYCIMSLLTVMCVFGFIVFNWPKAKVFMGDAGSYFLGLYIAIYIAVASVKLNIPLVVWLIVYAVFWFDTTVTLIRRILAGVNFTVAHRDHAYQRLQNCGWPHKKILFGTISLNITLTLFGLLAYKFESMALLMFACTIIMLSIVYVAIEKIAPMSLPLSLKFKLDNK